jgi:hypothetical protein
MMSAMEVVERAAQWAGHAGPRGSCGHRDVRPRFVSAEGAAAVEGGVAEGCTPWTPPCEE